MQRAYADNPLCSLPTPPQQQGRGEPCFVKASPSYNLSCKGRRVEHTVFMFSVFARSHYCSELTLILVYSLFWKMLSAHV